MRINVRSAIIATAMLSALALGFFGAWRFHQKQQALSALPRVSVFGGAQNFVVQALGPEPREWRWPIGPGADSKKLRLEIWDRNRILLLFTVP